MGMQATDEDESQSNLYRELLLYFYPIKVVPLKSVSGTRENANTPGSQKCLFTSINKHPGSFHKVGIYYGASYGAWPPAGSRPEWGATSGPSVAKPWAWRPWAHLGRSTGPLPCVSAAHTHHGVRSLHCLLQASLSHLQRNKLHFFFFLMTN